jgi:agmatinase
MPTRQSLLTFLDKPSEPGSEFFLFAAPLDVTTSNRSGARFGPNAIRRESSFLDTYSARSRLDWEDLALGDIGDIECETVEQCLANIEETIRESRGFPVMIGGEHTITLGALRALRPDAIVVFDAHLDVRDELFGEYLCHATYLRRALEELDCKALVVGARAFSGEEIEYAGESSDLSYITAHEVIRDSEKAHRLIDDNLESVDSVYLSVDVDVLDPAYAPAVGNPHPEGLSTMMLLDAVDIVMRNKVVGMDLNEVYPHYDTGITATVAAYVLMESLYSYLRQRKQL